MFDTIQTIGISELLDLGVPEGVLVGGEQRLSAVELDALANAHACYYEFLLIWHPHVRRMPDIVGRLDQAGLLEFSDKLQLFEQLRPVDWMVYKTGSWRHAIQEERFAWMDAGYMSLHLSPDEFCAKLTRGESSLSFVAYEPEEFLAAMRRVEMPREVVARWLVYLDAPAEEAAAWLAPHLEAPRFARVYDLLTGKISRAEAYDLCVGDDLLLRAIFLSYPEPERRPESWVPFRYEGRIREALLKQQALYLCAPFFVVALALAFRKQHHS